MSVGASVRVYTWLGLVVCVACSKKHTEATVPIASVLVKPDPSSAASVSAGEVATPPAQAAQIDPEECASFDRRLDAKLHAAIGALGDAGTPSGWRWTNTELEKALPQSGLGCLPFVRGSWQIEPFGDVDMQFDSLITSNVKVAAMVDGKKLTGWSPSPEGVHVGYGGMPTTMKRSLVTDYDGDGLPELWARTDEDGVEGGHFSESFILTVASGKVAPYGPTTKLGDLGTPIDEDGDGRLDLPVSLDLVTFDQNECYGKGNSDPGDFLAHSLSDGTFSTTDAVARAHVKKWCPAAPTTIKSRSDALCARIWAAPADLPVIRARITASCVQWDCALEYASKPQKPGAAHECNDMLDTFDQKTSFTLRP